MAKSFTCYAIGGDRGWEAICIDLDIAVQGDSFGQVYDDLNQAVTDYVETALLEDKAAARDLLARRAPLSVRLHHKLHFLRTWLFGHTDGDGQSAGFTVACRA
jgi:hypothetical protein